MLLTDEPAEVYHRNAAVGSTRAKIARQSLRLYKDYLDGLVEQQDKPCFQVGRLAHLMVLEPERFARCVVTEGPINPKTVKPFGRDSAAFAAWAAENKHLTVVEPFLVRMLARMPGEVRQILSYGQAETTVRIERGDGDGSFLPVQCRPDWMRLDQRVAWDLKTIDDIDEIDRAIRWRGYWFSAGWYRMVLELETGHDFDFRLIFCEKSPPHRWRIVRLSADYLEAGDSEANRVADLLTEAYRDDQWTDPGPIELVADKPAYLMGADDFTVTSEGISL